MATRIAFGSCSKQHLPQPLWPRVIERGPSLFIWGGDAVYHDSRQGFTFVPSPLHAMRANYDLQRSNEGYSALRSSVRVVGTWDDHDFGLNDAGSEYSQRQASQKLFLDFLGESEGSERRSRQGVYTSHTVVGRGGQVIKVVLLDARFHRSEYRADGAGSILGEEQWRWLRRQLTNSTASAHLLVSGVQVLPEGRHVGEGWWRMPAERERLLNLILSSGARAPVLLSGDVHFAELNQALCQSAGRSASLVEVTSSGMTHAWGSPRAVPAFSLEAFVEGRVGKALVDLVQHLMPFSYLQRARSSGRRQYYSGLNFGELEFSDDNWTVTARLLNRDGGVELEAIHALQDLGGSSADLTARSDEREGSWQCTGHLGHVPTWQNNLSFYFCVTIVLRCA